MVSLVHLVHFVQFDCLLHVWRIDVVGVFGGCGALGVFGILCGCCAFGVFAPGIFVLM